MIPHITWQCAVRSPDGQYDFTVPAEVPGCVHTDLMRAGIVKDLFWRDNNDQYQWIENCDATYTGTFTLTEIPSCPHLIFRGLDVYTTVFCNGSLLGKTDNMHISWDFDVSACLRIGENTLTVVFRSPIREIVGYPDRIGAFTRERIYTRRIQCTYGWDWVGRFVTMGIWKPVELVSYHADDIGSRNDGIYVYTENINAYTAQVGIDLTFARVSGNGWVRLEIADPDGVIVWSKKRRILQESVRESVSIRDAKLWFPAGYGAQPLYVLTCRTYTDEMLTTQTEMRTQTFGIRQVCILEPEDLSDSTEARLAEKLKTYPQFVEWDKNEGSSAFWLLVNGVRIFCQGANWVPTEPFPSAERAEKVAHLVHVARLAGLNMLRVWGGGVFAGEDFYNACDREGILTTQDFLMACGNYPEEDPVFLEQLRNEAREAAWMLRNHPSLVWWSGDNENAILGDENLPDYRGRKAALVAIGPVLAQLDPTRRFLPSSPYGGVPYASGVRGTSHNTQYLGTIFAWMLGDDHSNYREFFDSFLNRFTAEHPSMGYPFPSSLRKFMTEADLNDDACAMARYHTKDNPALPPLLDYMFAFAQGIFGPFLSAEDRLKKMQWLHCEWVRISQELYRRHAWYTSGILYWMWNDCWPAACSWSFLDYYGIPKPGYYMFKRCAKPLVASIVLEDPITGVPCTRVYLSYQGNGEPAVGTCRFYRYHLVSGEEDEIRECTVSIPAGSVHVLFDLAPIPLDRDTVLIADIETDRGCDRAFCLPSHTAYCDMAFVNGDAVVTAIDEETLRVYAPVTIPFVLVDPGDGITDENAMFMKAGETRILHLEKFE